MRVYIGSIELERSETASKANDRQAKIPLSSIFASEFIWDLVLTFSLLARNENYVIRVYS